MITSPADTLIRDSFIPAFVGLEKTLRSKLEEVKNDWE